MSQGDKEASSWIVLSKRLSPPPFPFHPRFFPPSCATPTATCTKRKQRRHSVVNSFARFPEASSSPEGKAATTPTINAVATREILKGSSMNRHTRRRHVPDRFDRFLASGLRCVRRPMASCRARFEIDCTNVVVEKLTRKFAYCCSTLTVIERETRAFASIRRLRFIRSQIAKGIIAFGCKDEMS